MRWLRRWTVRVVLVYVGLFGLSVVVLLGFIYGTTVGFIDRQINATITAELTGLNDRYKEQGLPGLVEVINERMAADRTGETVFLLTDGDYARVAGNIRAWPTDVEREGRWASFEVARGEGEPGLEGDVRALSFLLDEGYHLLVGRHIRDRQNFENLIAQAIGWALAITAGLGALGGWIMSRDMARRLDAINRTTQRIMKGDLHERVPVGGSGDEFDRLAQNLNDMLAQIDRLMVAMREVSDNVAHDLRSPLSRLRSRLEVTLLSTTDADELRRALETSVAEVDGLLSTFNALLSIAQAESGTLGGTRDPIDLDRLCADVAELYEPVADARGQRLTLDLAPDGARTIGNRHLMFQAVTNLIDNAIKYAPAGTPVMLATRVSGERVEVIVADRGAGIPVEARARVVQRFVRLDASRTTTGNGLGLSLVTAVMTMHGGRLRLEDNDPGLRSILDLPRAA